MSHNLFDDTFVITSLNPHKKRFARVDRLVGKSTLFEMDLLLDINSEIYTVKQGDEIALMLTHTPYSDGKPDPKEYQHDMSSTLMDQYDYVTYGKVFKIESVASGGVAGGNKEPKVAIMISFGGLLMKLSGDQKHVARISIDSPIYCFVRKTKTNRAS
ncbi:dna-directed rna polymerases and iii subunit rpabc3-like isoform x1 [Nannochloropsis oceanica]